MKISTSKYVLNGALPLVGLDLSLILNLTLPSESDSNCYS